MRALAILAILAILLARSVAAESVNLAAFTSDGSVTLYRLDPTKITKISTRAGGTHGAGWTDARTFWVATQLAGMKPAVQVDKIVDGKPVDTQTMKLDPWQTRAGTTVLAQLQITTRNEVWVEMCTKHQGDTTTPCVEGKWIRVDGAKQTVSASEPSGIDRYRTEIHGRRPSPPFPTAKQPKGHAVTLQQVVVDGAGDQKQRKVNGAVCKGPSSSTTWPEGGVDLDGIMKPARVTWLREAPAVAMIEGAARDATGAVVRDTAVFLDCREVVDQALWLGAGYWGLRRQEVWTIYSGDKPLGSLAGVDLRAAAPTKN